MGFSAGNKNVNGFKNVFIGYKAGEANVGGIAEEGSFNVMIGNFCGYKNTSGGSNTFLGYEAGRENLSGYHNTYIGRWAGMNMTTGHHNVFIGTEAGRYEAPGANYRLHINAYSSESPVTSLIYGEFDNKIVQINGTLNINDVLKLIPRTSPPPSPTKGTIYYDNATNKVKVWTGSAWENLN